MNLRSVKTVIADVKNVLRYGWDTPLKNQTLWIDPTQITVMIDSSSPGFQDSMLGRGKADRRGDPGRMARRKLRQNSNVLTAGNFDHHTRPLAEDETFQRMKHKFQHDLSWEEAGFFDWMMERIAIDGSHDGCRSYDDVVERYSRLDRLIEIIRSGQTYAAPTNFVTRYGGGDGIFVAVGREGEIIFCGRGKHRLSIAQSLAARRIPVCVCAVQELALISGAWQSLNRQSAKLYRNTVN